MNGIVGIIILIGICFIIVSFVFFGKEQKSEESQKIVKVEKKDIQNAEEEIRNTISSYSDEIVEDTTKKMNEESNEKIMAISEFSDSVMEDIKKAHNEVMFLYGMLNDKEKSIKEYVSDSAKKIVQVKENETMDLLQEDDPEEKKRENQQVVQHLQEQMNQMSQDIAIDEDFENKEEIVERKTKILELAKKGMNPIDIAKELALGIGEVQLIVDLYQGEKK